MVIQMMDVDLKAKAFADDKIEIIKHLQFDHPPDDRLTKLVHAMMVSGYKAAYLQGAIDASRKESKDET